jgi:hypothetical protein
MAARRRAQLGLGEADEPRGQRVVEVPHGPGHLERVDTVGEQQPDQRDKLATVGVERFEPADAGDLVDDTQWAGHRFRKPHHITPGGVGPAHQCSSRSPAARGRRFGWAL